MKGVRRRRAREEDARLSQAHLTATFTRLERLEPLDDYLRRARAVRERKHAKPSSILATLKALAASGLMEMTATPIGAGAVEGAAP